MESIVIYACYDQREHNKSIQGISSIVFITENDEVMHLNIENQVAAICSDIGKIV